jgi:hypothetical protein
MCFGPNGQIDPSSKPIGGRLSNRPIAADEGVFSKEFKGIRASMREA